MITLTCSGQRNESYLDSAKSIVERVLPKNICYLDSSYKMSNGDICQGVLDSIEYLFGKDSMYAYCFEFVSNTSAIEATGKSGLEHCSTEYIGVISDVRFNQFCIRIYAHEERNGYWNNGEYYIFSFSLDSQNIISSYCNHYIVH